MPHTDPAPGLWIHAGTYKTGSSSLQNHLWRHRDDLPAHGWLYPATGVRTDEPDTGARHSGLGYRALDPPARRRLWRALAAEIGAAGCPRVLLSSEVWSRPASAGRLTAMVGLLLERTSLERAHVVLYLRNRQAYARALYREWVRRRGYRGHFTGFIETNVGALDPVAVLESLRAAVGPAGTLTVWSYADHSDTTTHLCAQLGLPAPEATAARANPTEGAVVSAARRWVNELAPDLAPAFPGLSALGLDLDETRYAEPLPGGFVNPPLEWLDRLRALTGWSDAELDSLLAAPAPGALDVTSLDPDLERRVRAWIARRAKG